MTSFEYLAIAFPLVFSFAAIRLFRVVVVFAGVVGAVSLNERVHAGLAIGLTTFLCIFVGVVAYQPGPLGP